MHTQLHLSSHAPKPHPQILLISWFKLLYCAIISSIHIIILYFCVFHPRDLVKFKRISIVFSTCMLAFILVAWSEILTGVLVKTELLWVPCVTSFSFHVRWSFMCTAFVLSSAVFISHYAGILLDTMTCKSPSAFVAKSPHWRSGNEMYNIVGLENSWGQLKEIMHLVQLFFFTLLWRKKFLKIHIGCFLNFQVLLVLNISFCWYLQ
jgi:hypothetical protein